MDKGKLKQFLVDMEHKTIEGAEKHYEQFLQQNQLDREETIDPEDQSHHVESTDLGSQLDEQLHEHAEHLRLLEQISFEDTDTVGVGSVVKVNNRYFVVAFAHPKFKFEGEEFMGISANAPIFQCMLDKKAGDEFEFNNRKYKIQEVH